MTTLLLFLGLLLLILGADFLVRGASRLALAVRIPPLIVGLTVVAFGTSAPELAVSTGASLSGQPGIAIGNVVGSNIFNVLLILGLSALVVPLRVSAQLVRLDVPVMIGISGVLLIMAWNGHVGRAEGVMLLAGLAAYFSYLFRSTRQQAESTPSAASAATGRSRTGLLTDAAFVVGGLLLLVIGSRWLVQAATELATALGVSELVIGLTIIAGGTSLPELATSILAAVRGQRDIAVGNVVGSNILNILAILGVAATVAPEGLSAAPAAVTFDIPVMTAVAVLALPVFFSGGTIDRWEGGVFVVFYAAYAVYLVLHATGHEALPEFRQAMLFFVLPMAFLLLIMVWIRARQTPG